MLELLIVKISKSYSFSSSFMNKKTTTSLLNPVRRLYTYRWFATTNTFWNKHNAASNKKHNEEHNEEMFLINVSAKSQNVHTECYFTVNVFNSFSQQYLLVASEVWVTYFMVPWIIMRLNQL